MTPKTLTLKNSTILSWWEFGNPAGRPVFFFHGWPASGGQGLLFDGLAKKLGLRIISIDRPGFGLSTRQKGRGFPDLVPLVESLADYLKLEKFLLFGLSGGGPYALACAEALGPRISSTLICCGAPPLDNSEARKHFLLFYRLLLGLRDLSPKFLHALLIPCVNLARIPLPWPLMRLLLRVLDPHDRKALDHRERFAQFYPSFLASMKAGTPAIFDDGDCYARPWGFSVENIQVPVTLWHGTADRNFHYTLAEALAARIPGAGFTTRKQGHYSLPTFCAEEMLVDMLKIAE